MSSSRTNSGLPPKIETMVSLKVDNLTYRTTPEELRRVFQKYGDVGDVYIPRDRNSRTSRGFAFVRFYERRDAEDAMEAMDGKRLDGRELRVQLAKYGRPSPPRSGYKPSRRRSRSRSRSRNRSGGGGGGGRYRDERRRSSPSPKKRRSRTRSRSRSPRASRAADRNGGSVSPVKNNRSASPASSRGSRSPVVARREPRAAGKRRDSDGNDFGDAARVSKSRSRSRSASRSRSRSASRSS